MVTSTLSIYCRSITAYGVDSVDTSLGETRSVDDNMLRHHPLPGTGGEQGSHAAFLRSL